MKNDKYKSKNALQFGDTLQALIKDAGLNREAIANYLQCSTESIDSWCCGRTRINPAALNSICSLLAINKDTPTNKLKELYQLALESYGFSVSWIPETIPKSEKITLCLAGSLSRRKEIMAMEIIAKYLNRFNQQTLIFYCSSNIDAVLSCIKVVNHVGISNLVMCGMFLSPASYSLILEEMYKRNICVTMIGSNCPKEIVYQHRNAFSATWDYSALAYRATKLLIEAGHTRIGTINFLNQPARFNGYLQALKDSGLRFLPELVLARDLSIVQTPYVSITDPELMNQLEGSLLKSDMSAVFAPSEYLTIAIPLLFSKHNTRVYDDMSLSGLAYPGWIGQETGLRMTYIAYPIEQVTQKALEMLLPGSDVYELQPEERYIDVTGSAKRIDMAGGSIKYLKEQKG